MDKKNIFTSSTGTVYTTATTSGAAISVGFTSDSSPTSTIESDVVRALRLKINELENDLVLEKNENTRLLVRIDDLEKKINNQTGMTLNVFSDKELKIILSKIHPDKNSNKESYSNLTKKINLWRSK